MPVLKYNMAVIKLSRLLSFPMPNTVIFEMLFVFIQFYVFHLIFNETCEATWALVENVILLTEHYNNN